MMILTSCGGLNKYEHPEFIIEGDPTMAIAIFIRDERSNIRPADVEMLTVVIEGLSSRGFKVLNLPFSNYQMIMMEQQEMQSRMQEMVDMYADYPFIMIAEILTNPIQATNQAASIAYQAKLYAAIYSQETKKIFTDKLATEGEGTTMKEVNEAMVEKLIGPFNQLIDRYLVYLDTDAVVPAPPPPTEDDGESAPAE